MVLSVNKCANALYNANHRDRVTRFNLYGFLVVHLGWGANMAKFTVNVWEK